MEILGLLLAGITQVLLMFAQLINYLLTAPGDALFSIFTNWGQAFEGFGIAIPIVFVLIIGITGLIAYTLIEMGKVLNDSMDIGGMAGAGGSMEMVAFLVPMHSISLDLGTYIIGNIGNAIINGLGWIFQAIIQGLSTEFSDLIVGLENAVGIPFSYWSSNLQVNYFLPVVFIIILGIALIIGIAFIDIMGYEKDIGEGVADLSELFDL